MIDTYWPWLTMIMGQYQPLHGSTIPRWVHQWSTIAAEVEHGVHDEANQCQDSMACRPSWGCSVSRFWLSRSSLLVGVVVFVVRYEHPKFRNY